VNASCNSFERRPQPVLCGDAPSCHAARSTQHAARAFTLIELLVVISILGILAALTVPALKNLGKSNIAVSAARQMLDDVGRARQIAIGQRTTVYMVFVPTNFWAAINTNTLTPQFPQIVNLSESQLSGYNFVSQGAVGDQPGNHPWRYQSTWQSLPQNSYIAAWKFYAPRGIFTDINGGAYSVNSFARGLIPFPTATNAFVSLPFIAFNYLGQLTTNGIDPSYQDEYIPLAQGTVGYGYNGATKSLTMTLVSAGDITETPPGNSTNSMFTLVHIDALTGRARLEFQQVQ
jgi:prepilin-type N-terminal cleavage/methylation domain-containing protein